jgi:hypothetical protein
MRLGETMEMRISAVAIALIFCACGGESSAPTSPSTPSTFGSPSPPAPPDPSPKPEWTVTQSFVSVAGPDNCWVREQRATWTGAVFPDLETSITRSDGQIAVESGWFQTNYKGTYSGRQFSASGTQPLEGGGRPCQDGTVFRQEPGVSTLSGTFSADDQQMTAMEVNSYVLNTGEPVTYTWGWQARRRN